MKFSTSLSRWKASSTIRLDLSGAFIPLFALYTLTAIALLLLGLLPDLATISGPFHDKLEGWGEGQGVFANVARATLEPAHVEHIVSGTGAVVRDYFFSLLNLFFGVFLVWRRPGDWVARLLGLGMIGTAVAYNFYAHEAVFGLSAALPSVSAAHIIFHGAAGTAYLHALLPFSRWKADSSLDAVVSSTGVCSHAGLCGNHLLPDRSASHRSGGTADR